jgi:hypothetical protein
MAVLAQQIGIRGRHYLSRDKGESAYEVLKRQIEATREGESLVLVFPPEQLVDSSFADESIVRLGEQILKNVHGERGMILEGLTEDSITNFRAVLKLRGIRLPLLVIESTGEWRVLGNLERNLLETLQLVHRNRQMTAAHMVSQMGLAVNTASTRLKRLHNVHLVRREYEVSEKGLQYIYYWWL